MSNICLNFGRVLGYFWANLVRFCNLLGFFSLYNFFSLKFKNNRTKVKNGLLMCMRACVWVRNVFLFRCEFLLSKIYLIWLTIWGICGII